MSDLLQDLNPVLPGDKIKEENRRFLKANFVAFVRKCKDPSRSPDPDSAWKAHLKTSATENATKIFTLIAILYLRKNLTKYSTLILLLLQRSGVELKVKQSQNTFRFCLKDSLTSHRDIWAPPTCCLSRALWRPDRMASLLLRLAVT